MSKHNVQPGWKKTGGCNGTVEPVSRDHILRRERGRGKSRFPFSADHEQDWQPYPADSYSAGCAVHTFIPTFSCHKSMSYIPSLNPFCISDSSVKCRPSLFAQFIPCDVATVCFGMAASMGAFLLGAGTQGKRKSLPNSRIMIHQPLGGAQGQAADIEIQVRTI